MNAISEEFVTFLKKSERIQFLFSNIDSIFLLLIIHSFREIDMKKLVLSLMSVAMVSIFLSCAPQNFKDNILILQNNSEAEITFQFRGEVFIIKPA